MIMLVVIVRDTYYLLVFVYSSMTNYRRDSQRVRECVGIFKGESAAGYQRLSIVNKAVIVAKALEYLGVDEANRAEPATVEVNSGDVTTSGTHVRDLNSVSRYATGKRGCGSLTYHYISAGTLFSYPVRLLHCPCCVKQMQKRKKKVSFFIQFHDSESYVLLLYIFKGSRTLGSLDET
jgi:hypothetical protein